MNTLEHIGIQRWKLRNDRQNTRVPSDVPADDVSDPSETVTADATQSAELQMPQSVVSSNVSAAVPQENIVVAETRLEPESAQIIENQGAQESSVPEDFTPEGCLIDTGWQELAEMLLGGSLCESCTRSNPVLGDGNLEADWVFIFDAPSLKDVSHQQLLSGRDGQLFDAILDAIGLNRESIYLTSVFKCPPSQDLSLIAQCGDIVHRQLDLIKPKVVVTLGEFASQTVLRANENLSHLRSQSLLNKNADTLVAATYSLSQMLESPELKASVWQDLKKCLAAS